jgi:hypothetical protein
MKTDLSGLVNRNARRLFQHIKRSNSRIADQCIYIDDPRKPVMNALLWPAKGH